MAVLGALLLAAAPPLAAQDQTSLGDLAELLAAEDRREFDATLMARGAQHPDSLVRQRAAMAMGRIGDRLALPLLLRLLEDRDTVVKIEAAFAIGRLGDRAAVRELARQLEQLPLESSGSWPVEIVSALARLGGPEADAAIAALLGRHAPETTAPDAATAYALLEAWRLGRASRTAALLPDYVRRAGGLWRQNAVYSAGRLNLAAAAPVLLEAAEAPEPVIRMYALRALTAQLADSARLGHDAFTARIRTLLNDPDAQVRINALRALGTFADSNLAHYAAPRLVDRDPNVPVQAAATLAALRGSRAIEALRARLVNPGTPGLQRALLVALAQLQPDSAVSTVSRLRAERDWRSRFLAVEVLGNAATAAAKAALVEMLADADARVVAAAMGGIGRASEPGDSAVLRMARERLTHDDVGVRAAAIELLGREANAALIADFVAAYRRADTDRDNDAKLAAVTALAAIARRGADVRAQVEQAFLASVPRSGDVLVRRAVAQRFGDEAHRRHWGSVLPVETGRSAEDYREAVRRYVLDRSRRRVTIETDRGNIIVELLGFDAPLTVDNFLRLMERRYFDNGRWHRVVPNFVIQDGDPRGDGSGGPGWAIRDEINRWRYSRGMMGMALSGPETGGSQFFITHSAQPHLDGGYTIFGRVVGGETVLDQIVQGDRIRRIFR
jgi:cyclophilin family peptidyl-prolyl cis-trans isomerase/HEAT repeat protein